MDVTDQVGFTCPVCQKWLAVPLGISGAVICTKCGHRVEPRAALLPSTVHGQTQDDPSGELSLREESVGAETVREPVYLPVVCSLCGTRMYGREGQAGETIKCPDCYTMNVVPALSEILRPAAPVSQPSSTQPSLPTAEESIPLICPLCSTRMYATPQQIGREIQCPDCHTAVTVPNAPPEERVHHIELGDDDDFRLSDAIRPRRPTLADYLGEHPVRRIDVSAGDAPLRPARLLEGGLSAVLRAMLRGRVLVRFAFLSGLGVIIAGMLAYSLAPRPGTLSMAYFSMWVSSLYLAVVAFLLGGVWMLVASATFVTIIEDTADGNRPLESWPEGVWIERLGPAAYVVGAISLGAAPGALASALFSASGAPLVAMVGLSLLLLFPVLLLSMLFNGSAVSPLSSVVLRSLSSAKRAWIVFYAMTTLLAAVVWLVAEFCLHALGGWAVIPIPPLAVLSCLLYGRWLGRMAAVCIATGGKEIPVTETPPESPPGSTNAAS